ncbi:MAG: hypothetical protein HY231_21415 [Acidobacteria bacterium]|nr:hypothetical protein [Acidobacteriota bacterium]
MPFPNFYPPLFYWCVALLHHTHLVSFGTAFKLMVALPVLLLPAAVWLLAWAVSDKNRLVAISAALAIIPLLIDFRFYSIGLSYHSTFLIGLYTQPLGFVLLVAWCVTYLKSQLHRWRFTLSCLLLALTVLTNFFNAITAILFVLAILTNDLVKYQRTKKPEERLEIKNAFAAHLCSPLIAVLLTLFWLVPMFNDYDYFVTRPQSVPLKEMIPFALWVWYAISLIGIFCWLRRPTKEVAPFLSVCFALIIGVIFTATVSPRWFPLQAPRFVATLNVLLAVPVGHLLAAAYHWLERVIVRMLPQNQSAANKRKAQHKVRESFRLPIANIIALTLIVVGFAFIQKPSYKWAFHETNDSERIDGVLRFASQHRDGRYLVEVPEFLYGAAALDGRGLNSYLGAQGNEAVSVVFREASPNAIFFNPLVNTLSAFPDSFGISSMLADDLDFVEQPLARHLERARLVGVRYVVIVSPNVKIRLAREPGVKVVFDSQGGWSIFEIASESIPQVRPLKYRPALVVSNFSLKLRQRNEYDFVRLAEEQFAEAWFDVALVRSTERKIDRLQELNDFGALILDVYAYDDENVAFERLREFAQYRPLLLLSSDATLFHRIKAAIADFPFATVIERVEEGSSEWLEANSPSFHYASSSVRKTWQAIRYELERQKIAIDPTAISIASQSNQNRISINLAAPTSVGKIPVLIETTYHPNWRREDGEVIYATTPFFMLTFVGETTSLIYERRASERIALNISALMFLILCCLNLWLSVSSHTELGQTNFLKRP